MTSGISVALVLVITVVLEDSTSAFFRSTGNAMNTECRNLCQISKGGAWASEMLH